MEIKVGARRSKLSQIQVQEVLKEVQLYHKEVSFSPLWIDSKGDLDQKTPLSSLGKTDFFTQEIDQALLLRKCRLAVHSAKDLPALLPLGLSLVALTKGVSSKDLLVLSSKYFVDPLPKQAKIGTSSLRREALVKALIPNCQCFEIRGTVDERLKTLGTTLDGAVIAKAALLRLGELENYPIIPLIGPTAPFQGRLAVLARSDDREMAQLFSSIDARVGVYYPGITKGSHPRGIHVPLIETVSRGSDDPAVIEFFKQLAKGTHLIFTSKEAVFSFLKAKTSFSKTSLKHLKIVAIGQGTANALKKGGMHLSIVAKEATQEEVLACLASENREKMYCLWPHSSLSRPVLTNFFKEKKISFFEAVFYDTFPKKESRVPDFNQWDEIFFTSPSVVEAYLSRFHIFPQDKILTAIGPVTYQKINEIMNESH